MRALALLCFVVAGCGGDFLPVSYLGSFRILDLHAEPPEIAVGETTQLAVTGFPDDGVSYTWSWCSAPAVPGAAPSFNPDCVSDEGSDALVPMGQGATLPFSMPDLPLALFGPPDETGGLYLPIRVDAVHGDEKQRAIYGLRRHLQAPPNHNPGVASLSLVAADQTLTPLSTTSPTPVPSRAIMVLHPTLTDGSEESYTGANGMVTETITINWFADAGGFSWQVTGTKSPDVVLDLTVREKMPGEMVELLVIVGDERGGNGLQRFQLLLQ
jgi:hypothetical protein